MSPRPPQRPEAPPPLTTAAAVVGIEGAAYALFGLSLVPSVTGERLTMGLTTLVFMTAYGAFLGFCALRLWRLHSWARAPIVMAQLIQIPVALSFWGGQTRPVTVVMLLVSAVVLAGVFHPQSTGALEDAES